MDKEVKEIIRNAWCEGDKLEKGNDTFGNFLNRAANDICKAGYHKVSGKPLVLNDEEIEGVVSEFCSYLDGHRQALTEVARAQRDADVLFYAGDNK